MALFDLTPVPGLADAPAWAASTHRGPCRVAASDERRARLYAAHLFTDPEAPRSESGLLPASPWPLRSMVTAAPIPAGRGGEGRVPDGTVLVPDDPREPTGDGAFRVFGRI